MAKSAATQAFVAARNNLLRRLDELEAEVQGIKTVLEHGAAPAASRRAGPGKRGRKPGRRAAPKRRRKRGASLLAILQCLKAKGPAKPAVIAKATGVTYGTVSNTLNTLQKKKHVSRSAKGWSLTTAGAGDLARRAKA